MQWYYIADGTTRGPVSDDELRRLVRAGVLKRGDAVWNESLGTEWVTAGSVSSLFGPPPLPEESAATRAAPDPDGSVSCASAVRPAWEGMKRILFAPFDLAKWFALGVSAWLATLGGGGFNFRRITNASDMKHQMRSALDWAGMHLPLVLGVGFVVVAFSVALGLVLLWLRCRGKFMFLDNVLRDRAEVVAPWQTFAPQGNSLFKWCVVYGLVCAAIMAVLIAVSVWGVVIPCVVKRSFVMATMPVLVGIALAMVLFGVVAAYVGRFLEDFVAPLMYRDRVTATEAWRRFMPLLRSDFWSFILYGLFYMVLGLAAAVAVAGLVLITCCIAGCLLLIPYISAVVLLPATVFFRLYSLAFLAQFGPEWDVRRE